MLGNTQTLSIASGQDTFNLPSCAMVPFFEVCDMIGCSTNNCFCPTDIMQSAMMSMSASLSEACSGEGMQSATQEVESYCAGNVFAITCVCQKPYLQYHWVWLELFKSLELVRKSELCGLLESEVCKTSELSGSRISRLSDWVREMMRPQLMCCALSTFLHLDFMKGS